MVGLTLEGGGTRGSYQVGAYFAMKHCHVKIDGVNGTSIGSFNAAMIASHQENELLEFWKTANMAQLLDLNGFKNISVSTIGKTFNNVKSIIKNKGIDTSIIKDKINELIDLDKFYNSKMDFGLVTVRLKNLTPIYKYKDEISRTSLCDYIVASCCLPVFKLEKNIDSSYYVDGGFYDNCPVNMWIKKGYNKIYVVSLNGPGFKAKYDKSVADVVFIKPSRPLGSILNLKEDKINDNIRLGYFDTLKVLKKLDGKKYCFKKRSNWYYDFINRKVSSRELNKMMNLFAVNNSKDLVIKTLEFIMKEDNYTYYKVYSPLDVIKTIKKGEKKTIIYKYVKKLKFLR